MAKVVQNDSVTAPLSGVAQISLSPSTVVPPSPTPEWDIDPVPLKDFTSKKSVPGFAKIVKGNYMTLGTAKFSFQRQHHEVFIHSVKVAVKVLAHCLRRVDATTVTKPKRGNGQSVHTTRVYAVDQRLAIPISYQGWFELLSEDGKSARPINSVHELSKVGPEKVLVRENIKAYKKSEDGKMSFDSSKIILAGDQLLLCGDITIPTQAENKKVKLLRCFDSKGNQVFLSFDQKGVFTPIAGEKDFVGVFSIRDIIRRFRLPLTVKLVQGVRPKVDPVRFTGLVRLDWVYSDETAFVCPIERNHIRLLPVPVDTSLHLVAASNQQAMKSTELYSSMWVKCNRMISNYNNTIHLIVNLPDAAARGRGKQSANMFSGPLTSEVSRPSSSRAKARENKLMDEIDDLYGYVREGGPPPIIPKFEYESDEESYFEEPAYEPLDDFRARLRALEAGEKVEYHSKYKPQDVSKIVFETDPDTIDDENPYGVINGGKIMPFVGEKVKAPPLPPRPSFDFSRTSSSGSPSSSTKAQPLQNPKSPDLVSGTPPIPPRRASQPEMFFTTVSTSGIIASHRSSKAGSAELIGPTLPSSHPPKLNRKMSRGSQGSVPSNSGSSGGRQGKLFARDFQDSDISSMTKRSSGSSSDAKKPNARRKMQTLYL